MKTVDPDILSILSGALIEGPVVKITKQLPRDVYVRVDKVLKDLGGRWDGRKAVRGHVFPRPAEDVIDGVCLTGSYEKWTHGGFFETPEPVAEMLVERARLEDGRETILEPSAGCGALADVIACHLKDPDFITCIEIRSEYVAVLREKRYITQQRNFLETPIPVCGFHRVIMNPPFEHLADIRHVQRAYYWVEPGCNGRLVSVMSPGWTFRADRVAEEFRAWLKQFEHTWEPLPDGSFKTSGTGVRTGILTIEKE